MEVKKLGEHPNPLQVRIRRKESRNGKQGRLTLHRREKLHALTVKRRGLMMSTVGFFTQS
jgi:hypothetical protein